MDIRFLPSFLARGPGSFTRYHRVSGSGGRLPAPFGSKTALALVSSCHASYVGRGENLACVRA
ncbi:hypothetical protein HMPREF1862_00052 [Varibaculum cambriense]|uniref:Uncharacterized protein n=1 Tax=Varibaculum cambriense TaxID=184870 RepID=A0AB34X1M5_9ACTO|nr:hypothetical protein HMPREF1862_00052 [Varibaculum cambriense]